MPDENGNMTPEESYAAATAGEPSAGEQLAAAGGNEPAAEQVAADIPEAPKVNPSWEEAWKDVPEPIREQQRQYFERWDRDYQELQARHRPFQEYEQAGVSPAQLQQALEIQAMLISNPREFYDRIGESWGFAQQQDHLENAVATGAEIDPDEYDDPTVAALARQVAAQQQIIESWNQQTVEQQQAAYEAQQQQAQIAYVDGQMTSLESKIGQLSEDDKVRITERAILNASMNRNATIEVAYYDLKREEDAILARVQRQAPRVLGNGGGTATNQPAPVDFTKETAEERIARAMAVAKATVDSLNSAPQ